MKIKLISSNFDPETGISTATIQTPLGFFTGKSTLHKEDDEYISSFAGCKYAEFHAILKFLNKKIQEKKKEIKTLQNFEKILLNKREQGQPLNIKSIEQRTLRKEIYLKQKQLQQLSDRKFSLHNKILTEMKQRTQIIKKFKQGDEK